MYVDSVIGNAEGVVWSVGKDMCASGVYSWQDRGMVMVKRGE